VLRRCPMNIRIKPVTALTLVLFFIMSCTKGQISEKAKWSGEIGYEDGVKIVKNPSEPVYGEISVELEEELSIGREDDENYLFYDPRNISVDEQRNIYILERGNHRIQKFDKDGNYLQTIGKKGQGPGEFERPYSLVLDKNNNIYVSDRRKIHFFNHTGEFVKTIPLSDQVNDFTISHDGNIFGLMTQRIERERTRLIVEMNSEGKILKNIAQLAEVTQVMRKSENVTSRFSITHDYNFSLYFAFSSNNQIYYGTSSEYSFSRINLVGEVELIIKKEGTYQSISQKEKDKIFDGLSELIKQWPKGVVDEAVQFPAHRPFFNRILIDDKGRIYIKKVKPVLDETKNFEFDVFSPAGYLLYKINLPFSPEIIQNGHIYDLFTSEETGEIQIKRYNVINWNQIAENI
jgi:hypothetical protein